VDLRQHNDATLVDAGTKRATAYTVHRFNLIRQSARQARAALGLSAERFARVITNNYSRAVTAKLVELCGFPHDAGCFANIGRFAHASAGDILVNLKDLEANREIAPGDLVFLMADSVTSIAVLCLHRRDAQA
jgi:3-oxoacyl-[acyl-carrier-protein] synthase III